MFDKNLGDMIRQAQEMGKNLKAKQEELALRTYESSVGGGMVKLVMNGKLEAVSISIDPSLMNPADRQMLEDLVLSAVNLSIRQAQQAMEAEMAKMTGGFKMPGFPT